MEQNSKNKYRLQVINVIKKLLEENPISEELVHTSSEDKFFEDACNFVKLRYELSQIKQALETAIKYSEC